MASEKLNKVFWGSPERWISRRFGYRQNVLKLQLNALLLTYDEVIISPSFLLESPDLDGLLDGYRVSLECGFIKLCFSDLSHGLCEYSHIKSAEEFGNIPAYIQSMPDLLPVYDSSNLVKKAIKWNGKFEKASRSLGLPGVIGNLLLGPFLPTVSNDPVAQERYAKIFTKIINDSKYYTKYCLYQSLAYKGVRQEYIKSAMDRATQAFIVGSSVSTGAEACMSWPLHGFPNYSDVSGIYINIYSLINLYISMLGININDLAKLNEKNIIKMKNLDETKILKNKLKESLRHLRQATSPQLVASVLCKINKKYKFRRIFYKKRNMLGGELLGELVTNVLLSILSSAAGLSIWNSILVGAAPSVTNKLISTYGSVREINAFEIIKRECIDCAAQYFSCEDIPVSIIDKISKGY